LLQREFLTFKIGILGIAPGTAKIAAGKADKNTGVAGKGRFSLKGIEYFIDG
jgi:hypothetical protein